MSLDFSPLTTGSDTLGTASLVWAEIFVGKLGQNIDVNGKSIVSTLNGDITIAPDGTGDLLISNDTIITSSSLNTALVVNQTSTGIIAQLRESGVDRMKMTSGTAAPAVVFTVNTTNDAMIMNQQGTGSIFKLQDDGATTFLVEDGGQVSFKNYSFPVADGSSGQVLETDGVGNLTFVNGSGLTLPFTDTDAATTVAPIFGLTGSAAFTGTALNSAYSFDLTNASSTGTLMYLNNSGGNGKILDIVSVATTAPGFKAYTNATYTGSTTSSFFTVHGDNAAHSGTLANFTYDGAGTCIDIDSNGNAVVLDIDSANTSKNVINSTASGVFTGTTTSSANAFQLSNGSASGTLMYLSNSGSGRVIDVVTSATSGQGIYLTADSITGGNGLFITADGLTNGNAAQAFSTSTSMSGVLFKGVMSGNNVAVTGSVFRAETSGSSSLANCAFFIGQTSGTVLSLRQVANDAKVIFVNQDTDEIAIDIDSEATTASVVRIDNAGTGASIELVGDTSGIEYPEPNADGEYSCVNVRTVTCGSTVAHGDMLHYNGTNYVLADADAIGTADSLCIALESSTATSSCKVAMISSGGVLYKTTWNGASSSTGSVYLSTSGTTTNTLTSTAPSGTGDAVIVIGYKEGINKLVLQPISYVEVA